MDWNKVEQRILSAQITPRGWKRCDRHIPCTRSSAELLSWDFRIPYLLSWANSERNDVLKWSSTDRRNIVVFIRGKKLVLIPGWTWPIKKMFSSSNCSKSWGHRNIEWLGLEGTKVWISAVSKVRYFSMHFYKKHIENWVFSWSLFNSWQVW